MPLSGVAKGDVRAAELLSAGLWMFTEDFAAHDGGVVDGRYCC